MSAALERWKIEAPPALWKKRAPSLYAELFGSLHNAQTRCAVVDAHPNDEIVGAGCLIARLANVDILHISNAAPRSIEEVRGFGFESIDAYAKTRREECLSALEIAGVHRDHVFDLELPQFEASSQLVPLTLQLVSFIQQTSPQIVLTHAYEGGHPDHDAAAFATHSAVRILNQSGLKPPTIFEMAIYPARNGLSKVPDFLHNPARESTTLIPDNEARALKLKMFECFDSQREFLNRSPLGPEKFRQAPNYDFTQPPHDGVLHYENFDWDFTGERWREFARDALAELFEPSVAHRLEKGSASTST